MTRRAIPDFIRDAAAKAAQPDANWAAELEKRRHKQQHARSITTQMRQEYQRRTLLPASINGTAPQAAASDTTATATAASSSSSRQSEKEVRKEAPVVTEPTKLASPQLSSSPSTLPSTFLEWRAKRAATSAAATDTTASTSASAVKQPLSTNKTATRTAQATTQPSAATAAIRQPNQTIASPRPATHLPSSPSSQQQPHSSSLPACPQGTSCTRQNATHRANFSHFAVVAQVPATTSTTAAANLSQHTRVDDERVEAEVEDDGWMTGTASSTTVQHKASKKRLRRLSEEEDEGERIEVEQPAGDSAHAMHKPACPYGAQCYRVNPVHLRQYQHPLQTAGTMKAGHAR